MPTIPIPPPGADALGNFPAAFDKEAHRAALGAALAVFAAGEEREAVSIAAGLLALDRGSLERWRQEKPDLLAGLPALFLSTATTLNAFMKIVGLAGLRVDAVLDAAAPPACTRLPRTRRAGR